RGPSHGGDGARHGQLWAAPAGVLRPAGTARAPGSLSGAGCHEARRGACAPRPKTAATYDQDRPLGISVPIRIVATDPWAQPRPRARLAARRHEHFANLLRQEPSQIATAHGWVRARSIIRKRLHLATMC